MVIVGTGIEYGVAVAVGVEVGVRLAVGADSEPVQLVTTRAAIPIAAGQDNSLIIPS